ESHSCPWGPPLPVPAAPFALALGDGERRDITLIDSGYQWLDSWPSNPLGNFLVGAPQPAQYLGTAGNAWQAGANEDVEAVETTNAYMYALAGHANFVAGVMAWECDQVRITIVNHDGRFGDTTDDFPTEAAVARSLCRNAAAPVIDLGFAFRAYQDILSCVWE